MGAINSANTPLVGLTVEDFIPPDSVVNPLRSPSFLTALSEGRSSFLRVNYTAGGKPSQGRMLLQEKGSYSQSLTLTFGPSAAYTPTGREQIRLTFASSVIFPPPPEGNGRRWRLSFYLDISAMDFPQISKEVKVAVTTLQSISSVLSMATCAPMGVTQAGKISLFMRSTNCPSGDEVDVDATSSPTQETIGKEFSVRIHLGALVWNYVFVISGFGVHFLICVIMYLNSKYVLHPVQPFMSVMAACRFPQYSSFVLLFFYQSLFTSGIFIMTTSENAWVVVIGVAALLFLVIILILLCRMTIGKGFAAIWLEPSKEDVDGRALAASTGYKAWYHSFTECDGKWIDKEEQSGFCRKYRIFFGDYVPGRQWFICVDTGFLMAFGVLGGINATSDSVCYTVSWGVAVLFLGYLIALLALKPFNTRLNAYFFILMTVLQLGTAILCVLIDHDVVEGSGPKSALILGCSALMIFKTLCDLGVGAIDFSFRVLKNTASPSAKLKLFDKLEEPLLALEQRENPHFEAESEHIAEEMRQRISFIEPNGGSKMPEFTNSNPLSRVGMPLAERRRSIFAVDIDAEMQRIKDAKEAAKKGNATKPAVKTKVDSSSGSSSSSGSDSDDG